jgi:hypothetical protein
MGANVGYGIQGTGRNETETNTIEIKMPAL